jgi:hypothetical protein
MQPSFDSANLVQQDSLIDIPLKGYIACLFVKFKYAVNKFSFGCENDILLIICSNPKNYSATELAKNHNLSTLDRYLSIFTEPNFWESIFQIATR